MIDEEDITKLLVNTSSLINHIYWVNQEFDLKPSRKHLGVSINFTDITYRKDDFVKELINSIIDWVYSKKKAKSILHHEIKNNLRNDNNAYSYLTTKAFNKFRANYPNGQFGELLLFNFIQFFFEAVPILRKIRITTSTGHERFGSDAIHFKIKSKNNIILLGESKCYESKYTFKKAFETSLNSIFNTFSNFYNELDLYINEDFLEEELLDVADDLKNGTLKNVKYELVSLIIYNENKKPLGKNEKEIKKSIVEIISEKCESLNKDIYKTIDGKILDRINYIIFPVWELDLILEDFSKIIGKNS